MNLAAIMKFRPARPDAERRIRLRASSSHPPRRPPLGLSLMEAVAVLGVMMIILVMVSEIFSVNMNLITTQLRRTDTSTGAIQAIRQISEQARGASAVVASRVIDGTSYVTSDDTLVLQMPSIDGSGDIVPGQSDYVAFYHDPGDSSKIYAIVDPGTGSYRAQSNRLMSGYNSVMTFRYNSPTESDATRVSVYIENSRTYRDRDIVSTAWTSIFLRNR
jgi:hypothetical protein